jgi:hypothetical protein
MQNANACAVLYYLWPFRLYHIPHYLTNKQNLGERVIEQEICVVIFSRTSRESFIILRIVQRDIVINVCNCSCQLPVILVRF